MKNKLKTIFSGTLLFIVSLFFAMGMGEIFVRSYLLEPQEKVAGAKNLFESFSNVYIFSLNSNSDFECQFSEMLISHPNIGTFFRLPVSTRRCLDIGNNQGFNFQSDYQPERSADYFTILITGGSVADIFSRGNPYKKKIWLEEELNNKYYSPNGKPFRIMGGAFGAAKEPFQVSSVAHLGNLADALLVLDGFNEANWGHLSRMDYPPDFFVSFVVPSLGPDFLMWGIRTFRKTANKHEILTHSFLLYKTFMAALTVYEKVNARREQRFYNGVFGRPVGAFDSIEDWNVERYIYYAKLLRGEAQGLGIKYAHFLQPIPGIEKKLTATELKHHPFFDAKYYMLYVAALDRLASKGYPTRPISDVFANERGEIYGDFIHFKDATPQEDSRGNILLAQRMAKELSVLWKLKTRPSHGE